MFANRSSARQNFSLIALLPLISMPIFFLGLYPYFRELMEKFVFPKILQSDNQPTISITIALTIFSSTTSIIGQLAELTKPGMAPHPDSSPLMRYIQLAARIALAGMSAAATGLLTKYQKDEFNFDLQPSALAVAITLLAVTINALSASTIDAVRGYEVHEVGETSNVLAYLSIAAILLAKLPTNSTLTEDFGLYIYETANNIKAACSSLPRSRASTASIIE